MDGAIEFLLKAIGDQLSLSGDDKSALLLNLDMYLPDLYSYSILIMTIVVKPIAYAVLGFLLLLEFQKIGQQAFGNSTATGGLELLVPLLIKVGLSTLVMRQISTILKAILDVGLKISQGIADLQISGGSTQSLDTTAAMETVRDLGFFSQMILLIILLIPLIFSIVVGVLTKVIVFMRFLELYVYLCVSPLPVATLPNSEVGQIGKNFFKLFGASALQGVLLFIVLSFYPILIGSAFSIDESQGVVDIAGAIIGYCIALGMCLFYTGKWSKSIMTAA